MKNRRIVLTVIAAMLCLAIPAGAEEAPRTLPVYTAEFVELISVETIDLLCRELFPYGCDGDGEYDRVTTEDGVIRCSLHRYGETDLGTGDLTVTAMIPGNCILEYRVRHELGDTQYDVNDTTYRLDKAPYGCTMSKEEAVRKAGTLADLINPGLGCVCTGKMKGEVISNSRDTIRSKEEAYYLVFARQEPLALPALHISACSYYGSWKSRREEYFRLTMTDEGIDAFMYTAPVRSAEESGEQQVITAKEAMKIAAKEAARRKAAKPSSADEMKLGYYLRYEPGEGYYYIPVWCYYDRKETEPDVALCIIRADSGDLISLSGE